MSTYKVLVRPMQEDDLEESDKVMRLAFGTFLGLPDPMKIMGDEAISIRGIRLIHLQL